MTTIIYLPPLISEMTQIYRLMDYTKYSYIYLLRMKELWLYLHLFLEQNMTPKRKRIYSYPEMFVDSC